MLQLNHAEEPQLSKVLPALLKHLESEPAKNLLVLRLHNDRREVLVLHFAVEVMHSHVWQERSVHLSKFEQPIINELLLPALVSLMLDGFKREGRVARLHSR